jgi:hypothetical protein
MGPLAFLIGGPMGPLTNPIGGAFQPLGARLLESGPPRETLHFTHAKRKSTKSDVSTLSKSGCDWGRTLIIMASWGWNRSFPCRYLVPT